MESNQTITSGGAADEDDLNEIDAALTPNQFARRFSEIPIDANKAAQGNQQELQRKNTQ